MTAEPHTITVATRIVAPSDADGNPRRGWIVRRVIPDGRSYSPWPTDFVDEGYKDTALRDKYPDAIITCMVEVTAHEYARRKGSYT